MINVWIIGFIVLVILFILVLFIIWNNMNEINKLRDSWFVEHRLDEKGRFQYSVDGNTWTYVMGYDPHTNYGDYIGPGFVYITFDSENDEEYPMWCNMLNTMQKCHEWNKNALEHYREGIIHYINK